MTANTWLQCHKNPSLFFLWRSCKCCLHSIGDIISGGPRVACHQHRIPQYSRALSQKPICMCFRGKQTQRVTYARQIGGTGGPRTLFPSYYLFPEMQYLSVWETPEPVGGDSRIVIVSSQSLGLPRARVGVWHVKLTDFPRYTFTTYPNARIYSSDRHR